MNTENALARHQEPDGRWDAEKHEGQDTDLAVTGLAALAFLGAGNTERTGQFNDNVLRGIDWIIQQQDVQGCIGNIRCVGGLGYHHAICALALCEAYGMARQPATGASAQKAIDYSVNIHQCPYSAWRYNPRQEPDTSVTGWFVMHLKAAKVARLKVSGEAFQGAVNWLDKVTNTTDKPGFCGYAADGKGNNTTTAIGLNSRLLLGWKPDDPVCKAAADLVLADLPVWDEGYADIDFYYWHYGTIGIFQMGGDYWKRWNEAMKNALLPNQRRGGDEDGSWEPLGVWCPRGGRVHSTAMGALCLEVYYRYTYIYRHP